MNKDLMFGIGAALFFIFLVIFIVTTDEPSEDAGPFPFPGGFGFGFGGGFGFFTIILFLGMFGLIVMTLLGRRKRPDDVQSLDQLYRESKIREPKQYTGNEKFQPEENNKEK